MQITDAQRQEFFMFWRGRQNAIEGQVSEQTMYWFKAYTARDNIGTNFGQLRLGKEGQWDLYHYLTDPEIHCDKKEALIASGLDVTEVAEEERREYYRDNCVNPDDPLEVAQFNRMKAMSLEELNDEIDRLELELANGTSAIAENG